MQIGKYVIGFLIFWFINLVISAVWFAVELKRYDRQDKREVIKDDEKSTTTIRLKNMDEGRNRIP